MRKEPNKFALFLWYWFLLYLIKKPLAKDCLLVFFLKSYYASLVDKLVVNKGYVPYPTRFPKQVNTSLLFDYILFPITCVIKLPHFMNISTNHLRLYPNNKKNIKECFPPILEQYN
ncbi:CBO0543 family protein [Cytobacillus luteolus]|uniref:CBO0543 family protein n=1 Tax=Litchfieldia luteola TaxID=682179 RepID=UPI00398BBA05